MTKRGMFAVVAIFLLWSILDFILHGLLLHSIYLQTAELWRPEAQIKIPLMYLVTFLFSICFVAIYDSLIDRKSLVSGIRYGVFFGLATGLSMGFGSYSYMPIPLSLAWSWFIGSLVEASAAGAVAGFMLKREA